MMKSIIIFATVLLTLSCASNKSKFSHELMICGDDKVWIIDKNKSEGTNIEILWQWEKKEALDQLPERYQRFFNTMDECKFVDGGTKLLFTSSGGGVLLIERETKKVLFYTYSAMAHSADLLPDGKIVVALSTDPHSGNRIEVYDINKNEQVLFEDSLYSGHGSVWMEKRNRFYALGDNELNEYSLVDWNSDSPKLKKERTWTIPGDSGHDLVAISDNELLLSEHYGVHLFNIDKEEFKPFSPLGSVKDVKSVNYDKKTKELIYTKSEESWWTYNIYIENPNKVITIPGVKLYKVRPNPF